MYEVFRKRQKYAIDNVPKRNIFFEAAIPNHTDNQHRCRLIRISFRTCGREQQL